MDYSLLHKNLPLNFTVLIPFLKFEKELEAELLLNTSQILYKSAQFFIVASELRRPIWCQAFLSNCRLVEFKTKNEAIRLLKSQPNRGFYFDTQLNQSLGHSINNELRDLKLKRIKFEAPTSFSFKYFVWGFLEANKIFICDSPLERFPLGWHEFAEDKTVPPNRAYLKLWEILTLDHIRLNENDLAIDLGASPGGWSWVLSQHVRKVISIDKAPLAPQISRISNIHCQTGDAFTCNPSDFNDCTWLFSDIICTPEKLYGLVQNWLQNSRVQNFVCTIKFKGECDFDILKKFSEIPSSEIVRLYQNKNEVTWIRKIQS